VVGFVELLLYIASVVLCIWLGIRKGQGTAGIVCGFVCSWVGVLVMLIIPDKADAENYSAPAKLDVGAINAAAAAQGQFGGASKAFHLLSVREMRKKHYYSYQDSVSGTIGPHGGFVSGGGSRTGSYITVAYEFTFENKSEGQASYTVHYSIVKDRGVELTLLERSPLCLSGYQTTVTLDTGRERKDWAGRKLIVNTIVAKELAGEFSIQVNRPIC
jgi:hypothetical protein